MYFFVITAVPHQKEDALLARLGVNAAAAVRINIDTQNTKHMPGEVQESIALLAAKAWAFEQGFTFKGSSFCLLQEDDVPLSILQTAEKTLTVEL